MLEYWYEEDFEKFRIILTFHGVSVALFNFAPRRNSELQPASAPNYAPG